MPFDRQRLYLYRPEVGCAVLIVALMALCVLPYFVVGAMEMALGKLHLWSPVAIVCILGIFVGSLINLPVQRIERDVEQVALVRGWHGWSNQLPFMQRTRTETVVAVNVGGCVIPTLLAIFEFVVVLTYGPRATWAVIVASGLNILVCYLVARPIEGLGIAMPSFVAALTSVLLSWLLLMSPEYNTIRAPAAFIAGVLGPLIGADLLHLRDMTRISVGVLSIGGAGTFDGIVLSGIMAALLA